MSESNYHGRMMNIAVVLRQMLETTTNPYLDDVETYKLGHRDARHAAAEIAAEADVRIAALEAQLAAAEAELAEIDNALWASMGDEKYDRAKRVNFLLREGSLKHQAEQQLAAAQERERAAILRGDWYEQWIEDTTLEDYREQGESEDDAKRLTARNMQGRRERMAEWVAAALAAAKQEGE